MKISNFLLIIIDEFNQTMSYNRDKLQQHTPSSITRYVLPPHIPFVPGFRESDGSVCCQCPQIGQLIFAKQ